LSGKFEVLTGNYPDWKLYKQTDGVAMGSLLRPLLANVFMCSIEETLQHKGKMPSEEYSPPIVISLLPDHLLASPVLKDSPFSLFGVFFLCVFFLEELTFSGIFST